MLISTTSLLASVLTLAVAEPATAGSSAAPSASVRIYRCVNSNGHVALQDAPCHQGRQQVRDMVRPKDPPPREPLLTVRPAKASTSDGPPPRVIVVHSQPLFECTTADGERYTADDGQGNPRWVEGPLVPVFIAAPLSAPVRRRIARRPVAPDTVMVLPPGRPVIGTYVASGGQWVRDSCQQLSRHEACSVLGEQRWALISRYNSALSSEREQLVREQRRVERRMEQQPCEG